MQIKKIIFLKIILGKVDFGKITQNLFNFAMKVVTILIKNINLVETT